MCFSYLKTYQVMLQIVQSPINPRVAARTYHIIAISVMFSITFFCDKLAVTFFTHECKLIFFLFSFSYYLHNHYICRTNRCLSAKVYTLILFVKTEWYKPLFFFLLSYATNSSCFLLYSSQASISSVVASR